MYITWWLTPIMPTRWPGGHGANPRIGNCRDALLMAWRPTQQTYNASEAEHNEGLNKMAAICYTQYTQMQFFLWKL